MCGVRSARGFATGIPERPRLSPFADRRKTPPDWHTRPSLVLPCASSLLCVLPASVSTAARLAPTDILLQKEPWKRVWARVQWWQRGRTLRLHRDSILGRLLPRSTAGGGE